MTRKAQKQPHVWVVEARDDEGWYGKKGAWVFFNLSLTAFSKAEARKLRVPYGKRVTRIAKYVREEA